MFENLCFAENLKELPEKCALGVDDACREGVVALTRQHGPNLLAYDGQFFPPYDEQKIPRLLIQQQLLKKMIYNF